MIFQDNVLKEYLKNVYFITGTACGGKTTISRALSKKYNMAVYDVDEQFPIHKAMSDLMFQPAMNLQTKNADEFFSRTYLDYAKWIINNTREQLDFVILDLIRLSKEQRVICDLHLTVDEAKKLTDYNRVIFLIKEPSNIIEDYCNRKDHEDFKKFINSATNHLKAKQNCNKTLEYVIDKRYKEIKNSDFFWIERNGDSTVENTLYEVEKHLMLKCN